METLEERVLSYGVSSPDKAAIIFRNEITTYGELSKYVQVITNKLQEKNLKKNDIVILQATTDKNYIVTYLALHILGCIVTPIDRKAKAETIEQIAYTLNPKYIIVKNIKMSIKLSTITYDELLQESTTAKPIFFQNDSEISEDIYDILYTTGTTGTSKGVVTTRMSVISAIQNEIEGTNLCSNDTLLIPIPLNHSFGIGKMRAILFVGGTLVLQNGVSMVAELQNNIQKNRCNCMICVPSALSIICRQAGESNLIEIFKGIRFIEVASEPFPVDLKKILIKALPETDIINRYGSTETPAAIYLNASKFQNKLESIGRPLSNVKIAFIDQDMKIMNEATKDNPGRLAIHGPMILKKYWKDDLSTKSTLIDQWVYSKDLAYADQDGFVFLLGRADDVINCGGKKIAPVELEKIIMQSNLINECVVVGISDQNGLRNQIPALVYVAKSSKDNTQILEDKLKAFLRTTVEKYKIPEKMIRLESIPRNYMGKIDRKNIKSLFD